MNNNPVLIRFCEVLSVIDDNAGLRIKVRLFPEDSIYKTVEDLPYCFPLIPKHLHINPKVGECVMVFLSTLDQSESNRFFIGPLTSQAYFLNYDLLLNEPNHWVNVQMAKFYGVKSLQVE